MALHTAEKAALLLSSLRVPVSHQVPRMTAQRVGSPTSLNSQPLRPMSAK